MVKINIKKITTFIFSTLLLMSSSVSFGATVWTKLIDDTVYYNTTVASCNDVTTADTSSDLEGALAAASAGGTLNICPGYYYGTQVDAADGLDINGANQTINGIGDVTLDLTNLSTEYALEVQTFDGAVINNLNVVANAGLQIRYTDPELNNVHVLSSTLYALYLRNSSAIFKNCSFINGSQSLYIDGTGNNDSPTFINTVFDTYTAMYVYRSNTVGGIPIRFDNCVFTKSRGMAVYVQATYNPSVEFTNCIFEGNVTSWGNNYVVDNMGTGLVTAKNCFVNPHPIIGTTRQFHNVTATGTLTGDPGFTSRPYPAIFTIQVDDYSHLSYFTDLANIAEDYGYRIEIVLSNTAEVTPEDWAILASYVAKGHEVGSHSRWHSNMSMKAGFVITYDGTPATATTVIDYENRTGTFSTTVTGGTGSSIAEIDLSDPAYDTVGELTAYIRSQTGYTCTETYATNQSDYARSIVLGSYTDLDISGAGGEIACDDTNFYYEEISLSKADIETNIPGYTCRGFAYPYNAHSVESRTAVKAAGYDFSRGGGSFHLLTSTDLFNMDTHEISYFIPQSGDIYQRTIDFFENCKTAGKYLTLYIHGTYEATYANWAIMFQAMQDTGVNVLTASEVVDHITNVDTGLLLEGSITSDTDSATVWSRPFILSEYTLHSSSVCLRGGTRADTVNSTGHITDYYGTELLLLPCDTMNIGVDFSGIVSQTEQIVRTKSSVEYPQ